MPRAKIAERLLALFTTRERAAAAVGDLLELHGGRAAFWRAVVRTTCELSWRFGLGLLAALLVVCFWDFFFSSTPDHLLDQMLVFRVACWTVLAAGAVFSSVRFGVFDPISRLAIALALLTGSDLFFCRRLTCGRRAWRWRCL